MKLIIRKDSQPFNCGISKYNFKRIYIDITIYFFTELLDKLCYLELLKKKSCILIYKRIWWNFIQEKTLVKKYVKKAASEIND